MSTYGEMQTNIATFLRRDDLSAEIPTAIKRAIAHYEKEDWPWNEERSTSLITVASTRTVALPSDFSTDLTLVLTVNSSENYALRKRTMQELEELWISSTYIGQPTRYAIYNDLIQLYPIPDAAYSLILDYYQALSVLTNSTDTNAWTTTAEDLIEARAMWWLAARVMRNAGVAQEMKNSEMEAYQNIRRQAVMRNSSGKIVSCD